MFRKKKVLVAMSGGIDSTAAVLLLQNEGYEVEGLTIKMWDNSAVNEAKEIAAELGIKHYVLDLKQQFKKAVVDYFITEYMSGRTPNPCVSCNKSVKFAPVLSKAKELGINYIATGHYVQKSYDQQSERYLLYRAVDRQKDQSYFLYVLTQEILAHTLFPLGKYTKQEIKKIAAAAGLKTANKKESQEICFIADDDYKEFILAYNERQSICSGDFVDTKGNFLGKHKGLAFYTVGQRKGLGIALGFPAYVVSLDRDNNRVILGTQEELYQSSLWAKENNFIAFKQLTKSLAVQTKIRYGAAPASSMIIPDKDGRIKVCFANNQKAITPGQSVVYYDGDKVIGGGIIDEIDWQY